jgi:hypothetical protein
MALSHSARSVIGRHRARLSARRPSRIAEAAERLLSAERFHARMIAALAQRRRFAEAANHFGSLAESDALPRLLAAHDSGAVLLWRLGVQFGLRSRAECIGRKLIAITLAEARQRAQTEAGARMVLAAYGYLPDWKSASPQERAAFALGRLVVAFRRTAS